MDYDSGAEEEQLHQDILQLNRVLGDDEDEGDDSDFDLEIDEHDEGKRDLSLAQHEQGNSSISDTNAIMTVSVLVLYCATSFNTSKGYHAQSLMIDEEIALA